MSIDKDFMFSTSTNNFIMPYLCSVKPFYPVYNWQIPIFSPQIIMQLPQKMSYNSFFPINFSQTNYGNSKFNFANLSKQEAIVLAQNNPKLERLSSGNGWKISTSCFINDIPFARRGTSSLLEKISAEIGEELIVTSALGTKNSPHAKGSSNCSHYNENNPKLDFGGGLNKSKAENLANKLRNTNYFSHIAVETNGDGYYHLDVQIKESAYTNTQLYA